jgi:hypothetical protein
MTVLAARLLPVFGLPVIGIALLAGCGTPPEPLPTAPPPNFGSPGAAPSGSAGVPTFSPPVGVPTAGYPTYQNPAYPTYPAYPTATAPSTPATTRPTGPPPAPKCTNGPTAAQILAVIEGKPGIPPNAQLVLKAGPYCAGTWQFSTVGEAGPNFDPLQVVTTGKPAELKLVEAGADVCSDHVHHAAPVGIRVWACGS